MHVCTFVRPIMYARTNALVVRQFAGWFMVTMENLVSFVV